MYHDESFWEPVSCLEDIDSNWREYGCVVMRRYIPVDKGFMMKDLYNPITREMFDCFTMPGTREDWLARPI